MVIQFGHQFWSQNNAEIRSGEQGLATSLTVVDSSTGTIKSTVVLHKGRWKYAEVGAAKSLKSRGTLAWSCSRTRRIRS